MEKTKEKKTFLSWVKDHLYAIMVVVGVILIALTLKTQTIILTDAGSRQYTVELQYSLFGYCVSAVPMTDEAQAIAADHMFLFGGADATVLKAANWISEKTDGDILVYASGYPRNTDQLTAHVVEILSDAGITAQQLDMSEE